MKRALAEVRVFPSPLDRRRGTLVVGAVRLPCALGRSGARWKRREGDGATPIGRFALRRAHYRSDRMLPPRTLLGRRPVRPGDWWSDDPADRAYNRLVTARPAPPDCQEWLARTDGLYDVIVEIGYNDRPVIRGRGSGIFWHVARPGFTPTAGCVATTLDGLRRALPFVGPRTTIRIG